jgi:hypothetical protein
MKDYTVKWCPLCNKRLIKQSAQDACGYEEDWYCEEEIRLVSGRKVNHYREFPELGYTDIHLPPYRIRNQDGESKIGMLKRAKTKRGVRTTRGSWRFDTVIKCPQLHLDTEQRLRDRIHLLLVML